MSFLVRAERLGDMRMGAEMLVDGALVHELLSVVGRLQGVLITADGDSSYTRLETPCEM